MSDSTPSTSHGATRRRFLSTVGWVAAGAAAADWRSQRAFAQTNRRVLGANDRIRLGFIGVGSMGGGHLNDFLKLGREGTENCEVVAVNDIWQPRKEKAKAAIGDGGKLYDNYRALLDDKNVDGVVIATPEHWHHRQCLDAMAAGKDVYLEKPLSRYLAEALEVRDAIRKSDCIVQIGAQYASEPKWHKAHEMLPTIGKVVWCQTSYCRNNPQGEWNNPIDKSATPDNLDWKQFLGPAPERDFSLERYFRWRKFWDYSSGICGDLFPHKVYPFMIVIGAEIPQTVVAVGGNYVHKEDREVPDTFHMMATFASGYTLCVAGSTVNQIGWDDMIRGHKARMELNSAREIVIRPEAAYAEELDEVREPVETVAQSQTEHRRNWLQCMRSRKTPNCGVDLAFAGMVCVALAEQSYREKKVATFTEPK
ncbi:MAG: Gfo/Idh/MocA family oxidoreductase [Fimbriimonadaceae bacterium]|nr:Gfo/Idh/MocA family oxidoreductase [Fimbriimonadaceae bacterium]